MDKRLRRKPQPFDSFTQVLKVLMVAGYCKLFEPRNQCTKICHRIYRYVVIVIVITYNLQHIIYVWQVREDSEKFVEALILELPEAILVLKMLTMFFETARLDKLIELMGDPIFAAKCKQDEEYMESNKRRMHKLSKFSIGGLSVVAVFWITGPIFKRMADETTTVPSYMPFKTDTWPRFLLANFFDTGTLMWVGYGHFNMDCLVATLYAQARVQLKITRYNLEHLFDDAKTERRGSNFKYLDVRDETIQERFAFYVRRYERIVWFTNEVTEMFGKAISLQFFLTSFSTCLVVYQMSSVSPISHEFMFGVGYYLAAQFQIFLFCYYGGMVEYESKFIMDSLYLGEWVSLSPRFRRQLLVAMSRWIRPITPRVSGIVPLSLTTFLTLTRSAYTLYTVLKSKNNRDNGGERTLAF